MRALLGWLALWAAGCASGELTEIVVTVEGEQGVRSQATSLEVKVASDLSAAPVAYPPRDWDSARFTIAVAPRDPSATPLFRLEVSALEAGRTLATARLVSGFVPGKTRHVRLLLEDACLNVRCEDPQTTCSRGACIDARADEKVFSSDDATAPTSTHIPAPAPPREEPGGMLDDAGRPAAVAPAPPPSEPATPGADEPTRESGRGWFALEGPSIGANEAPNAALRRTVPVLLTRADGFEVGPASVFPDPITGGTINLLALPVTNRNPELRCGIGTEPVALVLDSGARINPSSLVPIPAVLGALIAPGVNECLYPDETGYVLFPTIYDARISVVEVSMSSHVRSDELAREMPRLVPRSYVVEGNRLEVKLESRAAAAHFPQGIAEGMGTVLLLDEQGVPSSWATFSPPREPFPIDPAVEAPLDVQMNVRYRGRTGRILVYPPRVRAYEGAPASAPAPSSPAPEPGAAAEPALPSGPVGPPVP